MPNQLHGDTPFSQFAFEAQFGPFVAVNKSTSAHRSALLQYDSGALQFVMQFPDHDELTGNQAATPGGSVPVN